MLLLEIHAGCRAVIFTLLVSGALHAAGQSISASDAVKPDVPPVVRSAKGDEAGSADGAFVIRNIGKRQQFNGSMHESFDRDITSPKSAAFHPDGTRLYVNSLEGCATVVYDARSFRKLKVINHRFKSGKGGMWAPPSGYYPWRHYQKGDSRPFGGKPVEMAFSHGGRYLWVPYYRRSFDLNAQDPSALAVIDTRTDSIVKMFETGPLPKMVAISHSGKLLAVTHWGDNTVGLIDISSPSPMAWKHLPPVVIGRKLQLDFPLDRPVDRDAKSGLLLRGTVFTPDDSHMLIGCMGGSIAVVNVAAHKHVGFFNDVYNVRHIAISGGYYYASCNVSGTLWRVPVDSVASAMSRGMKAGRRTFSARGWQSVKVGGGARTLAVTPDGRYTLVACNSTSCLAVVDNRTFKLVAAIPCDSYPVGLALDPEGKIAAVTSQGRKGKGGNSVNLFRITR